MTVPADLAGDLATDLACALDPVALARRTGLAPDAWQEEFLRSTEPRVLLLDEVAGGLTEHECAALVELVRDIRRSGISIVWIEHVVHALVAVVDRLVVLHGGSFIGDGEPRSVINSPAVREIYMGIPADA